MNLLLLIPNSWLSPRFWFPGCCATNRTMLSKNCQAFPQMFWSDNNKERDLVPQTWNCTRLSRCTLCSVTLTAMPLQFTFPFLLTARHKAILLRALPLNKEVFPYRGDESFPKVFWHIYLSLSINLVLLQSFKSFLLLVRHFCLRWF